MLKDIQLNSYFSHSPTMSIPPVQDALLWCPDYGPLYLPVELGQGASPPLGVHQHVVKHSVVHLDYTVLHCASCTVEELSVEITFFVKSDLRLKPLSV